jgi:hypothetical protein
MIRPANALGAPRPTAGSLSLAPDQWPALMIRAGVPAQERFLEFFAATIRNKNTRVAYFRAVCRFLKWADERSLALEDIRPVQVAAYIEIFTDEEQDSGLPFSSPTIKQHLAAIKMLLDYLVTGQILPFNPASAGRVHFPARGARKTFPPFSRSIPLGIAEVIPRVPITVPPGPRAIWVRFTGSSVSPQLIFTFFAFSVRLFFDGTDRGKNA